MKTDMCDGLKYEVTLNGVQVSFLTVQKGSIVLEPPKDKQGFLYLGKQKGLLQVKVPDIILSMPFYVEILGETVEELTTYQLDTGLDRNF